MKKIFVGTLLVLLLGFFACPVSAYEDVAAADLRAAVDNKMELLIHKTTRLENSIQELKKIYQRIKNRPVIKPNEPLPAFARKLQGSVLKVDKKWEFLVIDLGLKNKITVGEKDPQEITVALPEQLTMDVIRDKKFIGTVKVTRVNNETAICDIASVVGGRKIMPGDQVLPAK